MSLVEDARILGGFCPYFKRGDEATCWYCRETVIAHELYHDPTCPWLTLPRIIAALEAAERIAADQPNGEGIYCACCGRFLGSCVPDCAWQALVSALAAGQEEH